MTGVGWLLVGLLVQAPMAGEPGLLALRDGRDGAPGSVDVRSEMGKQFRLIEAALVLDGQEVARRTAPQGQELEHTFQLWSSGEAPVNRSERVAIDGWLRPGEHALTVRLVFEGRNVGPFNYLENYKYRAESNFAFEVGTGDRPAAIQVVARERPGRNLPPEQKPFLSIEPAPGSGAIPVVRAALRRGP
jgi:hypothetical protein